MGTVMGQNLVNNYVNKLYKARLTCALEGCVDRLISSMRESETTKYNSLFQLFFKISEIIQFPQIYL